MPDSRNKVALDTPVAIIGAGPVGMSVALDLASRGVKSVILEIRSAEVPADARCNTVAARTMETFRRFGIADRVRQCGLPDDYPTDVRFSTGFVSGHELTRIVLPSRAERFDASGRSAPGFPDTDWLTPEPVHRASQMYIEPVLKEAIVESHYISLQHNSEVLNFTDHGTHVALDIEDTKSGERRVLCSRFLVGADGGKSMVRKKLDIPLEGDAVLYKQRSILIEADDLRERIKHRPPWMELVINHEVFGGVLAIDGERLWLVHSMVPEGADFDDVGVDDSIRALLGVGEDFEYRIIKHVDWTARRLLASRFRVGNVFLAGDAAHLWVPYGGYGMNAGIADGVNLSWKLAAVVNGWAPEALLETYQDERQPITEQVSRHAMEVAVRVFEQNQKKNVPELLLSEGESGQQARKDFGVELYEMNIGQLTCEGLNFGYYYDKSPVIAYDNMKAPPYTMGTATPSTVPGCRFPHFWLKDGTSLYDVLGRDFTLVRFDPGVDIGDAERVAREQGIPLKVLDIPYPDNAPWFCHNLIISRPDFHVGWRSNVAPPNWGNLLDKLRGAQSQEQGIVNLDDRQRAL